MRKAGISRVERIVFTGAFGARFDWANAVSIGMFPDFGAGIKVAANAAGMGAILGLLDSKIRHEAIDIARMVRSVGLAEEPDFQTEYILGMDFPHLWNRKALGQKLLDPGFQPANRLYDIISQRGHLALKAG